MYDVRKYEGFEEAFPALCEQLLAGNVWCYDSKGRRGELTQEHKDKILEINAKGFDVYAVLDTVRDYEGIGSLHMTSYLILGSETGLYKDDNDSMIQVVLDQEPVYAYACSYTVNHDWHLEEMGDICIGETFVGDLIRL